MNNYSFINDAPVQDNQQFLESVIEITSERNLQSLEDSLLSVLLRTTGSARVTLYHIQQSHDGFKIASFLVGKKGKEGIDHKQNMTVKIPDLLAKCLESDVDFPAHTGPDKQPQAYYLVHLNHQVKAVLRLDQPDSSVDLNTLILSVLAIYENFLAIIFDNERDQLTGLLNRKTFDLRIRNILEKQDKLLNANKETGVRSIKSSQEGYEYWLAVMDIDHFKSINDSFGHVFGDEVLLLMARIMEESFRNSDLIFRYGGEEFIVVLSPCSQKDALATFERFRKRVESYSFPQVGHVSLSIGVTRIGLHDMPAQLVGHADQALYHAKESGRNRTCVYEELVAQSILKPINVSEDIELF